MNIKYNPLFALLLIIIVSIVVQACAGMGSIKGKNVRIYHESIDKMVDITQQAIRKNSYSIISIEQRAESDQRTTISFANRSTAGQQMVSSMQAYVFLSKVDTADAVKVQVDNPDYSYGTPTDQRIDYAKILFAEIDKLLE
jgi:nucleosome binding factor SPN SPT16 subunit